MSGYEDGRENRREEGREDVDRDGRVTGHGEGHGRPESGPPGGLVEVLSRWEVSGGNWQVMQSRDGWVEIGLFSCDGEQMSRVSGARTSVLQVRDHGPGIHGQDAERVFERFYRADSSRTRETGGTGLGLSIVAAIIEQHDGTVKLEETEGGGATFTVRIPRQEPVDTGSGDA